MTGKLADVVMSVRNGEQVARKYQPIVFNPSTPAQVEVRAKLKLMSQLSAIMAPAIAFAKAGAASARNMFVKANYGITTYTAQKADVNLLSVKLTGSAVVLPTITSNYASNALTVKLTSNLTDVNRVLYFVFVKVGDTIRYADSLVVSTPGVDGDFEGSFNVADGDYFVYAYGVRDNTDYARAKFSNITSPSAEDVARIIVTSLLTNADVTLTETRAAHHTPSE